MHFPHLTTCGFAAQHLRMSFTLICQHGGQRVTPLARNQRLPTALGAGDGLDAYYTAAIHGVVEAYIGRRLLPPELWFILFLLFFILIPRSPVNSSVWKGKRVDGTNACLPLRPSRAKLTSVSHFDPKPAVVSVEQTRTLWSISPLPILLKTGTAALTIRDP